MGNSRNACQLLPLLLIALATRTYADDMSMKIPTNGHFCFLNNNGSVQLLCVDETSPSMAWRSHFVSWPFPICLILIACVIVAMVTMPRPRSASTPHRRHHGTASSG